MLQTRPEYKLLGHQVMCRAGLAKDLHVDTPVLGDGIGSKALGARIDVQPDHMQIGQAKDLGQRHRGIFDIDAERAGRPAI